MRSISYQFLVSPATVSKVIRHTCEALWTVLRHEVFRPLSEEMWRDVAQGFMDHWQFPNCCGAIDGKHCIVQNFANGESEWRNYKDSFSMVLLAMCDAQYKFVYVNAGGRGRRSDGGLFARSELADRLDSGRLHLPPPTPLPHADGVVTPHVIVADEAFGLTENMMSPFKSAQLTEAGRMFNYR